MSRTEPRVRETAPGPVARLQAVGVVEAARQVVRAPRRARATEVGVPALILLAALAVRLPGLRQPLWGDEVAAARGFTHHDIANVLASVRLRKNEPPFWYLSMWVLQRAGDLVGGTPSAAS